MKYVKRPIVIEAIQLTEKLFWEVYDSKEPIFGKFTFSGSWHPENRVILNAYISIPTLEGTMRADINDWIIKEPFATSDRKYYPCKPDIFEKTYSPVDESPSKSDADPKESVEGEWTYGYKFIKDLTLKANKEFGEDLSMEEVEAVLLSINYPILPESDAVEQEEMLYNLFNDMGYDMDEMPAMRDKIKSKYTITKK